MVALARALPAGAAVADDMCEIVIRFGPGAATVTD
jgi:hypothetical protein